MKAKETHRKLKLKTEIVKYSTFLLLLPFLLSCKKQEFTKPPSPHSNLMELEWKTPDCTDETGEIENYSTRNQYFSPAFHPTKPYQFCCYEIVYDSLSATAINHRIVVFDLISGQKNVLLENVEVLGNLAWNKKDWIAFQNAADGVVYGLNVLTHEQRQISETLGNPFEKNLVWIHGGNELLWGGVNANHFPYLQSNNIDKDSVITLVEGEPLSIHEEFTVSSELRLLARGAVNPATGTTFYTNTLENIDKSWEEFTLPLTGMKYGRVNWHPNGKLAYIPLIGAENNGLYELVYETKLAKKIYDFCDETRIYQIVCMPNNEYAIIQKITQLENYQNEIMEESRLWLYDLKKKKEAPIPLDEF